MLASRRSAPNRGRLVLWRAQAQPALAGFAKACAPLAAFPSQPHADDWWIAGDKDEERENSSDDQLFLLPSRNAPLTSFTLAGPSRRCAPSPLSDFAFSLRYEVACRHLIAIQGAGFSSPQPARRRSCASVHNDRSGTAPSRPLSAASRNGLLAIGERWERWWHSKTKCSPGFPAGEGGICLVPRGQDWSGISIPRPGTQLADKNLGNSKQLVFSRGKESVRGIHTHHVPPWDFGTMPWSSLRSPSVQDSKSPGFAFQQRLNMSARTRSERDWHLGYRPWQPAPTWLFPCL